MLLNKLKHESRYYLNEIINTISREKLLSYECILAILFTLTLYGNSHKPLDVQALKDITNFISSITVNFLAVYYAALAISVVFTAQIVKEKLITRLTKSRILKTTAALLISPFLSIYTFIELAVQTPVLYEYRLILIAFITIYGIISVGGLILEIANQACDEINNKRSMESQN